MRKGASGTSIFARVARQLHALFRPLPHEGLLESRRPALQSVGSDYGGRAMKAIESMNGVDRCSTQPGHPHSSDTGYRYSSGLLREAWDLDGSEHGSHDAQGMLGGALARQRLDHQGRPSLSLYLRRES